MCLVQAEARLCPGLLLKMYSDLKSKICETIRAAVKRGIEFMTDARRWPIYMRPERRIARTKEGHHRYAVRTSRGRPLRSASPFRIDKPHYCGLPDEMNHIRSSQLAHDSPAMCLDGPRGTVKYVCCFPVRPALQDMD